MSTRTLTTSVAAAVVAPVMYPVLLVELDWPEGTVYVWSGLGTLSWSGHSWLGVGDLGKVSKIAESKDGKANGIVLSFAGIPSTSIWQVLQADYQGANAFLWLGVMNSAGVFQTDPIQIAYMKIDTCSIVQGPGASTININIEKEFVDTRSRGGRYTNEEQQMLHPGDTGLSFVSALAGQNIYWGVNAPTTTAATSQPTSGVPAHYMP